jgi:hypothetical protein
MTKQNALSSTTAVPDTPRSAPPPLSLATLPTFPYLLTTQDVATIARCSARHVMNQVDEGLLRRAPNLGRSVRFHPKDVLAFLGISPEPRDLNHRTC